MKKIHITIILIISIFSSSSIAAPKFVGVAGNFIHIRDVNEDLETAVSQYIRKDSVEFVEVSSQVEETLNRSNGEIDIDYKTTYKITIKTRIIADSKTSEISKNKTFSIVCSSREEADRILTAITK